MDFIENFFGKVWATKSQKIQRKPSTVYLKQIKKYVAVVADFIASNQIEGVVASNNYTGIVDRRLYLPTWIGCTDSKDLNKNAYLYLTLLSCATQHLKVESILESDSKIAKRMEFVGYYSEINKCLDTIFPNFSEFQKRYINDINENLKISKGSLEYTFWKKVILSRESEDQNITIQYLESLKSNDSIPDFLLLTTTLLPIATEISTIIDADSPLSKSAKDMTEQEKIENSPIKKINLEEEKKEFNPVTHAFEKLDTADDYKGGYRFDSGDDELMDHSEALKELEMSAVTTGGEAAQSIYSSDVHQSFSTEQEKKEVIKTSFLYPEWFSKNSSYSSDHCSLFETRSLPGGDPLTKLKVQKNYHPLICQYEDELYRILNQPTWLKRQSDGVELDIDEYVKFQSDVFSKNSSQDPKLYTTKNKTWLDIDISILFDQSLSTDSWIQNMRICDIIKESLVMMGIIFEDVLPRVLIAGTWSVTRKKCLFNIVKEQDEDWESFYKKVDNIEPQGYTRLGPSIRHINQLMKKNVASKKILIVLTDGKPSDIDSYEGFHGVQDVKKACMELEHEGVIPIAIIIDREAKGRFYTMFKNHFIISNPEKLPSQLFDIVKSFIH